MPWQTNIIYCLCLSCKGEHWRHWSNLTGYRCRSHIRWIGAYYKNYPHSYSLVYRFNQRRQQSEAEVNKSSALGADMWLLVFRFFLCWTPVFVSRRRASTFKQPARQTEEVCAGDNFRTYGGNDLICVTIFSCTCAKKKNQDDQKVSIIGLIVEPTTQNITVIKVLISVQQTSELH